MYRFNYLLTLSMNNWITGYKAFRELAKYMLKYDHRNFTQHPWSVQRAVKRKIRKL